MANILLQRGTERPDRDWEPPDPVYLNNWIDLIDCDDQGVIYAAGHFTDDAGHSFVARYVP